MVMADRHLDEGRIGRRSRGASPNNLSEDSSGAESDPERSCGGMRVGKDYQVQIPEYNPDVKREPRPDSILVWAPSPELPDSRISEYVLIAKDKHGYNTEQALGMLFWHKHNIDKALIDLANFTPFPDEWTVEDKVLFEQAFSFHGKSFHRIRQMLPDKSIASLVKYYYSWKKTRSRTSLMDRQARKITRNGEARRDSDSGDEGSGYSEGEEPDQNGGFKSGEDDKGNCFNCKVTTSQLHTTPRGWLCHSCYQYWRRSGMMRPAGAKRQHGADAQASRQSAALKHKRRPPRGMYLNHSDLIMLATGPPGQAEALLKALDTELVTLKRQVQNNKQICGMQKLKTSSGLQGHQPPEPVFRINSRWSNEELLLAVQEQEKEDLLKCITGMTGLSIEPGIRKYGKDFQAIAEVIGNKTEAYVRSFFINYRRRYNLDEVLAEFEAEHGMEPEPTIIDLDDDEDDVQIIEKLDGDKPSNAPAPTQDMLSSATNATTVPPPLLKQPQMINQQQALPVQQQQQQSRLLAQAKPTILQQPPPLRPSPTTQNGKPPAPQAVAVGIQN